MQLKRLNFDDVCRDLDFVFVYLDDILIASSSITEHLQHLRTLFESLSSHGIVINTTKCEFGKPEVNFLSHTINAYGIRPHLTRVKAAHTSPVSQDKRALYQFVGLINYYHRFVSRCERSYSLYIRPLQPTVLPGPPLFKKPLTQLNVRCPRL